MVADVDPRIDAGRSRIESISAKRVHRHQVDVGLCLSGAHKFGISYVGTGVRLVGGNVEVEIVSEYRVDALGVLSPFRPTGRLRR